MKATPKQGSGLHHFIAVGGKPKNYQGSKGVNSNTVNGKK